MQVASSIRIRCCQIPRSPPRCGPHAERSQNVPTFLASVLAFNVHTSEWLGCMDASVLFKNVLLNDVQMYCIATGFHGIALLQKKSILALGKALLLEAWCCFQPSREGKSYAMSALQAIFGCVPIQNKTHTTQLGMYSSYWSSEISGWTDFEKHWKYLNIT